MSLDPEVRHMLGLRPLAQVEADFLEAIKAAADAGLSPRQMFKLRPDVDLLDWMYAGGLLMARGKVRHSWRPLKQPDVAAQESVYHVRT